MRIFTLLFSAFALSAGTLRAQTVATFDDLTLPGTDTCYVNYTHPGTDVGFHDGLAYFPCVYDTEFGSSYWSYGFVYSSKTDTTTSGYVNQYSAKAGSGYGGSSKYALCYGIGMMVNLTGAAAGEPVEGFYVTNTTYAYNSMRDGDAFAKKFGDTTGTGITTGQGTAPDWFKLSVKGFSGGTMTTDSVDFYLADFRPAGTANDSIIKGWHWVDLTPLGHVDSLQFTLSSSDNGMYGMNTPSYFCMDNFTTHESSAGIAPVAAIAARVYPNPVVSTLNIDLTDKDLQQITITAITGRQMASLQTNTLHNELNTSAWTAGVYIINMSGKGKSATTRFVKE